MRRIPRLPAGVRVLDSVTEAVHGLSDPVVVVGSHGGGVSGRFALQAGAEAAVFHDAGVGRDAAGIVALDILERAGRAAATVAAVTARIGDGGDVYSHGIISHVNAYAARAGVMVGMTCHDAALLLVQATARRSSAPVPEVSPSTSELAFTGGAYEVWLLDSASVAVREHDGAIIITGSHGGLPGGEADRALGCEAALVAFNDAGDAKDGSGVSRLPALDARGIPAVAVSAASACIGSARSTLRDGVVSTMNQAASSLGLIPGAHLNPFIVAMARGVSTTTEDVRGTLQ